MRVLFVEDDPMNRRVVRDMLSVAEIGMDEADSGLAGLACLEAQAYDLVLMDLRMPGMDGFAAIQAIRARNDAKAETPIIVVTADTGPRLREQVLACGADDMILKPVALDGLFEAIGRLVADSETGHQLS